MKYPITPEYLQNAPKALEELFRSFEAWTIRDIARRLKQSEELTETAAQQVRTLQTYDYDRTEIEEAIRDLAKLSQAQYDEMYARAVLRNEEYRESIMFDADPLRVAEGNSKLAATVEAIKRQTGGELQNITQSLGFAFRENGKVVMTPLLRAYQKTLDNATMLVETGAADYNTAIRSAVQQLAASGLQWVDYESGWHNRADVAVRRAVMTGISQMSAKFSEQSMEDLETGLVEVTAHMGARDKQGVNQWASHADWQGKVYTMTGTPTQQYPSLHDVCGYGEVDGLCGANCRHHFYPFVEGVSERTYSDDDLRQLRGKPFTFEGKEYTIYEATQKQRQLETAIRKCRRDMIAFQALGEEREYIDTAVRCRNLEEEYKRFSRNAGLRQQLDNRTAVSGFAWEEANSEYKTWLKAYGAENTPLNTLSKYEYSEYRNTEEYTLIKDYMHSVEKGDISPLTGFDHYKTTYNSAKEQLVGQFTPDGHEIKSISTHFVDRIIGHMAYGAKGSRAGTPLEDAVEALLHGDASANKYETEDQRARYQGKNALVTFSVSENRVIQAEPKKRGK